MVVPSTSLGVSIQAMSTNDTIQTSDGSLTKVHPNGEAYHSFSGALKEAQDLYVLKSGFKDFLSTASSAVQVLDMGLGLGYNALTTIEAWARAEAKCDLHVYSLEQDDALVQELISGKASWQDNWKPEWTSWCNHLKKHSDANILSATIVHPQLTNNCYWHVYVADVTAESVAALDTTNSVRYDFVWHDPFSPSKNPGLWTKEWFSKVKAVSQPDAVLMTYSVAGATRSSLQEAGWQLEVIPTTTAKRNWLKATAHTYS
jgi:tRNA U34 5-methylaminomethyl-2-thiouridine-forming methyltransferase MnmC